MVPSAGKELWENKNRFSMPELETRSEVSIFTKLARDGSRYKCEHNFSVGNCVQGMLDSVS